MRIKTAAVTAMTGLALSSQVASAHGPGFGYGHYRDGDDYGRYEEPYRSYERRDGYGRVIEVDPLIDRVRVVEPYPQCQREWRPERGGVVLRRGSDPSATIIGGVAGAVIGHNLLADRDRGFGTVAGALVGGAIGNELGSRGYREDYVAPRTYEVERCRDRPVDHWQQRLMGYRVTYVFDGRQFTTRLPYDPGRRLRVDYTGRPSGP